MGGPIKKDKIFYFAGFEGFQKATSSTYTVQDPTSADWTGTAGGCTRDADDRQLHEQHSRCDRGSTVCYNTPSTNVQLVPELELPFPAVRHVKF